MIKGKTPEEIRKLFNIVNDFTPEEEVRFYFFTLYPTHAILIPHLQAQIKKENVKLFSSSLSSSLADLSLCNRNGQKTDEG
jgi:Skp1 family, dimerisation domain